MSINWGVCAIIGGGGTTAVSVFSGLFSNAVKQLTISISNPFLFFMFLVIYGLMASIAIGVVTVVVKGLLYIFGRCLVWLGKLDNISKIPIFIQNPEIGKLFRIIEKKLDRQIKNLRKTDLQVKKKISRSGCYSYKFFYANQLIYLFLMKPRLRYGPDSIEFYDGINEPNPDKYTAFGTIHADLKVVDLIDLGFLAAIQNAHSDFFTPNYFSYKELAERIGEKVSNMIRYKITTISDK